MHIIPKTQIHSHVFQIHIGPIDFLFWISWGYFCDSKETIQRMKTGYSAHIGLQLLLENCYRRMTFPFVSTDKMSDSWKTQHHCGSWQRSSLQNASNFKLCNSPIYSVSQCFSGRDYVAIHDFVCMIHLSQGHVSQKPDLYL